MKNFAYSRADTVAGAVSLLSQQANSKFLAEERTSSTSCVKTSSSRTR